ncbi:Single-stranded DNA-binding protein rim1, mitochondrial [Schizosaccharomyces pombe]|uniref:Single-stranded DNA-binding protein rim1, mitochondrial n=1 Tax=Schizosaccharomyces pombe (strain 972 / ATCC 24843) TaxID=284812 RepID=RIM1_SCHPO|nr:single-strand DNA-binding protein Rim1 [Schizosaccharomyces pombe]O14087.2 RecName: Full=Single-stranded DNA-binding protein rim1, mitochondrial; AltName: Full=Mitochondrial ssDNA-binding protein; Flags: Precursor [Schizosaccharomyces pombe 972h-]BAD93308.1 mitochondrial single-stranded DNA binding protein [Schizosaccharomyces pombe]CAB16271.2 mitochondrial single-stranded DNA binding protein Rim1 [Schizosaccharomyces pombe]|eukprot:NP_594383.1 single-strand DNA-binding protein Rim1 [Schizosaccharomyces pombe]
MLFLKSSRAFSKRLFSSSTVRYRDIQRLTLTGNLTKDVERLQSQKGNEYMRYTVASNNGKDVAPTFHSVYVFDSYNFDRLQTILRKGTRVYVEADAVWRSVPAGNEGSQAKMSLRHVSADVLFYPRNKNGDESGEETHPELDADPMINSF